MRKQMQRQKKRKKNQSDLLEMIRYFRKKNKKLHQYLIQLDNFIGMKSLKESIVNQIQFIITNKGDIDGHFLNTVLQGDPGCGKTTVAECIYNIWSSLDLFENENEFTILHRSDFVGSYMGHTANKTKKLLQKHAGGVIFIDEAYSLNNGEKDDYGTEALDQLNSFISEEKGKTIIIIAGYENELENQFFSVNPGLKRRFQWKFTIERYDYIDLYNIFKLQLKNKGWTAEKCEKLFKKHYQKFKYSGGDTDNIAFKAKLNYAQRKWKSRNNNKCLSYEDIEKAMDSYFKKVDVKHINMFI